MPQRPPQTCLEPGCPDLGAPRCPAHTSATAKLYRNAERVRIYNSKRWQLLRRAILRDHPVCSNTHPPCTNVATDVDHVIPLRDGGAPFDPVNLQGLCVSHHAAKTAREIRPH